MQVVFLVFLAVVVISMVVSSILIASLCFGVLPRTSLPTVAGPISWASAVAIWAVATLISLLVIPFVASRIDYFVDEDCG